MGIKQSSHEKDERKQRSYAATLFSRKAQQKKKDEVKIEQFADKPWQMKPQELDAVRFNDITIPRTDELNYAKCDSCLLSNDYNSIAEYICFKCEKYSCKECEETHGHMCSYIGATKRVKSDFHDLMKEKRRREKIMKTNISWCNRIYMKHDLDRRDCSVTGMSGIGDNGWVICDSSNLCIKLFDVNSEVIRRYIKFSALPFDVTELKNSQTFNALEKVQGTRENGKENYTIKGTEGNQQYLVAVTFPKKQQILVLNVKHNITLRHKIFKMDMPCYRIECCENKIFTLCEEKHSSLYFQFSVYMLSEDGYILKIIKTEIDSYIPRFAVHANRIFLSDNSNYKVKCLDFEGNVMSKSIKTSSAPQGICIGADGTVYLCSQYKICTIISNSTLGRLEMSTLITLQDGPYGGVLCFHRDKLYVGSLGLDNVIKVVRLV